MAVNDRAEISSPEYRIFKLWDSFADYVTKYLENHRTPEIMDSKSNNFKILRNTEIFIFIEMQNIHTEKILFSF